MQSFLFAQEKATVTESSAAVTKTAETDKKINPPTNSNRKIDSLEDFEKQLQKELEGTPDRANNAAEQPSIVWQFIRTLFTLAILLGIFYGIFRLYKFKRDIPAQSFSAVNNLYEYPLGNNQRLQIVEIAGRVMILGVSENSVQLVSEVTDKYTIDRIKLDCAEDSKQPRADFLTELSRAIKTNLADRFGKKPPMGQMGAGNTTTDSLESQRQNSMNRLRKLKSDKFDWRDKA